MTMLYNGSRFLRLLRRGVDHFMCDGSREHYNHVGVSDLIFKICGILRKDLALTAVFFTYFFVSAMHSVMPAYNYYTHISPRNFFKGNRAERLPLENTFYFLP
jgi:hypothetical protein